MPLTGYLRKGCIHLIAGSKFYYRNFDKKVRASNYNDSDTVWIQNFWDFTERVDTDSNGDYLILKSNVYGTYSYEIRYHKSNWQRNAFDGYECNVDIFPPTIYIRSTNAVVSCSDNTTSLQVNDNYELVQTQMGATVISSFRDASVTITTLDDEGDT